MGWSPDLSHFCFQPTDPGNRRHLFIYTLFHSEVTETKSSPLQQGFSEDGLSLIMETFSKEELNFEGCIGESWLDSLLGDPESSNI